MDSPVSESDDTGVSAALEKIISLESRLRQAIQNSHPLSSSFDRDAASADREREALLSVGSVLFTPHGCFHQNNFLTSARSCQAAGAHLIDM